MARQTILVLLLLTSVTALVACGLAESFLPLPTRPLSSAEITTYTVQPGDTASQIATRYHLTVEELIALNIDRYPELARNPSLLRAGWQLRVPARAATGHPTATAENVIARADLDQSAKLIVEGINTARAQRGLGLLRSDPTLTRVARDRSADMIARQYFSHYDPQTGQEPLLRYLQANNFAYQFAGENIAEIKNDAGWVPPLLTVAARYDAGDLAKQFVEGWINSPDHRANILNARYRRTGVALAVSADGRRIVATQVFSD